MLSACLESIRLCLDVFHSASPSHLFDISYTTLTLLSHVIVVLSKLCLLRTKDWDHSYARGVLSFADAVDRLIQKVNDAKALAGSTIEGDSETPLLQTVPILFLKLPHILQKVRTVYDAMCAAQASSSSQEPQLPHTGFSGTFTEYELLAMSGSSFSDFFAEDFWQQFT